MRRPPDKVRAPLAARPKPKRQSTTGRILFSRSAKAAQLIAELATIAEWREDLDRRIERAQVQFLYSGLFPEDRQDLEIEVEQLKLVCKRMASSMPGRLT